MTYERRLLWQEHLLYAVAWTVVFAAPVALLTYQSQGADADAAWQWSDVLALWRELLPFLALFLVHNFLVAPLLIRRKRKTAYIVAAAALLVLFAAGEVALNRALRPERPAPPPDGGPRMQDSRPPFQAGNPSEQNRRDPFRPGNPSDENRRDPFRPDEAPDENRQRPPEPEGPRPDGAPDSPRPDDQMPSLSRLMMDEPAVTQIFIAFLLVGMNLGVKESFRTVKNEKEMEELRRRRLEQELEYLRYQVHPHFFMNTLNNIHALVDINPEQAKSTIVELSRLMRYVLYDGSQPLIPLVKEVEFLRHYIALMRLRYTDEVRIAMHVPAQIPDVHVPPLLCINFVENAFKHGISYRAPSFIDVSLDVQGGYLIFTCTNSRHAQPKQPRGGIGLENIRRRLELLYGSDHVLDIGETEQTYNVLLKIPVNHDQMLSH